MQIRDFQSVLEVDLVNCLLEIKVIPRDKDVKNAVSNVKSLSGGERSFSTVALLMSFWSVTQSPFHCLDEYDVFTDQVNRHTITQMLLHSAKVYGDRQFVLLTPQNMSNIQVKPDLSIFK